MSPFSLPSKPLHLALLGLLLFLLPFAILRERSYVTIDDNLDTEISIPYLLTRYHVALDYRPTAVVPPVMNGLPRNAMRSGLSVTVAVFALLEPLPAYLVHQALVRVLALLGMYALLRAHFLKRDNDKALAAGLALAWAVLPVYSMYGMSVLGQPWLLLAFLNLRQGRSRWTDWALIAGFPLWSFFVFVGPFVLVALAGLLLWDWQQGRGISKRVLLGMALLTISYLVVEYPLLYSLLIAKQFVPHRVEFDLGKLGPQTLAAQLKSAFLYFVTGHYHASRFFRGAAVLAVGAAFLLTPAAKRRALLQQVLPLLVALAVVALFCGFAQQITDSLQRVIPPLRTFNLSRFHFLTPLLWFVVLVLSLRWLTSRKLQAAFIALQLLIGLGMNTEWLNNLRELAGRPLPDEPNYQAYVAPSLFADIQRYTIENAGPPALYRVACLGFPPSVAQLNGFYTLDSYQNNYPLAYKHEFRPLIAGELAKNAALRTYFDDWGNRCYLFSAELGRNFRVSARQHRQVQDWAFDAAAFQRLGGRYVLSAVQLQAPARSGLQLRGVFSARTAYWRVYLYEVVPSSSPKPGAAVGQKLPEISKFGLLVCKNG
ncbi:DUF6044 family protein [Hymenobacter sp. BT491]|uniref:DUF6044 family protein n=1 Tax=Hymenobacter sp. BT491 TaxID=2766779 RepID=UPI0016536889|nr:DUF6044 family protein [Hymenobacter sp. BT491]MBC6990209.1 hypothetical protein [Hymenobacter sp. BT491]